MALNIVIYGCDNSGKTTLCQNLLGYFDKAGIKSSYIKSLGPARMAKQVNFMHENLREVYPKNFIKLYDRFPIIEEEVCGPILRDWDNFKSFGSYGTSILNSITLFIHCDPGIESIQQWGERDQMFGIKENAERLAEAYAAYSIIHGIEGRTIHYDWTKDSWTDIAQTIVELANVVSKGEN